MALYVSIIVDALNLHSNRLKKCHRQFKLLGRRKWVNKKGGINIFRGCWIGARTIKTIARYFFQGIIGIYSGVEVE